MKEKIVILSMVFAMAIGNIRGQDTAYAAFSRLDYYTNEVTGEIAVYVPVSKNSMYITVDLAFEFEFLVRQAMTFPGHTVPVAFPLERFHMGDNEVTVSFYENEKWVDSRKVNVRLLDGADSEVKVDRLSGTLVAGSLPFVPVGFYCSWPLYPEFPEQEVVNGFNLLSPYWKIDKKGRKERMRFMDRCAELGLKVNYNLCSVAGGGGNSTSRSEGLSRQEKMNLLRQEVELMRDHPALLAWYISDEPVGQGVPPDSLTAAYTLIKELDPYHPVSIVFMAPHKAGPYREVMDIAMTDPYPIPHGPVAEVEQFVGGLHRMFRYEKPVWVVPQAFGGNEWWTREPTAAEVRAMTYLGVINGAAGIQYFIRKGPNATPKSQAMWGECGAIAQEMMAITPVLSSGLPAPAIFSSRKEVQAKAFNQYGMFTILAVNTSVEPVEVTLEMDEIDLVMEGEVMFESRRIMIEEGKITDMLDGYGTRIYRFDNRQKPHQVRDFHPANLVVDPGFENDALPAVPASCYATAGEDPGATYWLDGRVTKQGDRAIRFTTPSTGEGATLSFFGLELDPHRSYTVSVWGRMADNELPKEKRGWLASRKMDGSFMLGLGKAEGEKGRRGEGENVILSGVKEPMEMKTKGAMERFYFTEGWTEYSFTTAGRGIVPSLGTKYSPWIRPDGRGTAWFDALQVVPDMEIRNRRGEEGKGRKVEILSSYDGHDIFYTLDGTYPTPQSQPYLGPIPLEYTALLRAASYKDGELTGDIRRMFHIHKANTARVSYAQPYEQYTAGGDGALVDGLEGSLNYKDGAWQGFHGKDASFVVNLGETKDISAVSLTFLQDLSVWIFLPRQVQVSISNDGFNYQKVVVLATDVPLDARGALIEGFRAEFENARAKFIRVEARNIGVCPEWHTGAGEPAWIFLDEVVVE